MYFNMLLIFIFKESYSTLKKYFVGTLNLFFYLNLYRKNKGDFIVLVKFIFFSLVVKGWEDILNF